MSDVTRLPSSVGVGRCLCCGSPCEAGWTHFDPDEGICTDCAFIIAGPEFVRDVLGDAGIAAGLFEARDAALKDGRIDPRIASSIASKPARKP